MESTFIALLRAVNVSGANSLPTRDFVQLLEGIGLRQVRTYIQTGNAVFQADAAKAPKLAETIKDQIQRRRGFAPEVIVLTAEELQIAIAANPFPEAEASPKSLHLTFLAGEPTEPDFQALEDVRKPSERYSLKGRVFYFHAPEGVGRSKLFAKAEKALGVSGTARNWRTVGKLKQMAQEVAEAGAASAGP